MLRSMVRDVSADERLELDPERERLMQRSAAADGALLGRSPNGKFATDDVGLHAVAETILRTDPACVELAKTDEGRAYRMALTKAGETFDDCLPSRTLPASTVTALEAQNAALAQREADDEAIHQRALAIQQRDGVTYSEALRRVSDERRNAYYARQRLTPHMETTRR